MVKYMRIYKSDTIPFATLLPGVPPRVFTTFRTIATLFLRLTPARFRFASLSRSDILNKGLTMALNYDKALEQLGQQDKHVLAFADKLGGATTRNQVIAQVIEAFGINIRKGVEWDELTADEQELLGFAGKVCAKLGLGK